jgi:isocitrate dehydrogenase (NAD+)
MHRATLIPGDGIGPEVVDAARRAIEATGVEIAWDVQVAGSQAMRTTGTALPGSALASIRDHGVALKGPLETPVDGAVRNVNVELRVVLDLFAGVRPCRSFPGAPSRYDGVDLVVIRENTEAEYTGIEFEQGEPETKELIGFIDETTGIRVREDSGLSIKAISEGASERIVRFSFAYARTHGRSKVTAGHKANIMKFTDGVFLDAARRVAAEYPEVVFEDRIIDALTMRLVQRPEDHDVLVLPNLYGDILAELGAGLIGGPGLAPGANIGDELAVFETTHGTAPAYRGTGRANPMAMMLSGAMLLRHLGEAEAAERLEFAVAETVEAGTVTPDLKADRDDPSAATTSDVVEAVVARLHRG